MKEKSKHSNTVVYTKYIKEQQILIQEKKNAVKSHSREK